MIALDSCQREAIERLRNGNILCGEVGSGKSRTGLAYYFCKVCGGRLDGTRYGYEGDYVPMTRPKSLYIITTARKRDKREWEEEMIPFLLSTNPEHNLYADKITVTVDSWNNIQKYRDVRGAFFLFDEQRVVGSGPWSRAFIRIARSNEWIFLSATPGDTWIDYASIFIANGFYRNRKDFEYQHVIYNRFSRYRRVDRYMEEQKLRKLRDSILVNIDYVKPTVRHSETRYALYDREAYRVAMSERWNAEKGRPIENISELSSLLRRISNTHPSRQELLLAIFREHEKLIVFYNFDYELEILRALPYGEDVRVAEWNGHRHEDIPESERWVYLVQYTAGAEGWNCIQTDTIVFFSQNYSYKTTEQAMGRIDRRNTPYTDLYYYFLRSRSPIDNAIALSLKRKKSFNESRFFSTRKPPAHRGAA